MKKLIILKSLMLTLLLLMAGSSYSQKYNKIDNTKEICEIQKTINLMLSEKYDDNTYSKTGIIAYGFYNNIVIMNTTVNEAIDLEVLSGYVCEELGKLDLDFSNIRYLILANTKCEICPGDVIAYSGNNLEANISDIQKLKESSILLANNYEYSNDPDFRKIVNAAVYLFNYDKNWGSGTRNKRYSKLNEGCWKDYEKSVK